MATQLQIKRSTADTTPVLTYGELEYSTRGKATNDSDNEGILQSWTGKIIWNL